MTHLVQTYGLFLLFGLVAMESMGVPIPGETALIAAAILASNGRLNIVAVVVVASAAAIVGDNLGYWIGRVGGRRLLARWAPLERWSERVLPRAERFFDRHGGKTVFIGRFIGVLRITSAWLAGVGRMPWWRFLLWNAAGGIVWATVVSLVAYYSGRAAADAIGRYGLLAGVAALVLVVVVGGGFHLWRRRAMEPRREP